MSKKNNGASNALVQGSILAVASIISRIIGLIYRIPMQRILGDIGIGYYSTAFEIYNVMLIISSYSLPLAVSKMVSAQMAKKRRTATYQILKCALLFATISGTTVALILFFGGNFFATTLLNTPYSIFALRVLAPGLLVVAVLGVIRGFFQGLGTMMPSAVSQIIEQIVNAIVSVWAAYVLYRTGTRIGAVLGDKEHYAAAYGAAGGTLGTVLGSVAALLFVVFIFAIYMKVFKRQMKRERNIRVSSFGYTMKILVITVIPVLLSTTIYNISGIIDQGIFKQVALLQGYTQNDIDVWWGVYTGKYKLLINVPISIASAMAASFVPVLTGAYHRDDMEAVRGQINLSTRFIMVVAIESSGIAPALMAAAKMNVPLVILKKQPSKTLHNDLYQTQVTSFTTEKSYELTLSRDVISEDDNILLIDDFMADGEAATGAIRLLRMAHATVAGIGILIEKSFQPGRRKINEQGYEVYSLARIKYMDEYQIDFIEEN